MEKYQIQQTHQVRPRYIEELALRFLVMVVLVGDLVSRHLERDGGGAGPFNLMREMLMDLEEATSIMI